MILLGDQLTSLLKEEEAERRRTVAKDELLHAWWRFRLRSWDSESWKCLFRDFRVAMPTSYSFPEGTVGRDHL